MHTSHMVEKNMLEKSMLEKDVMEKEVMEKDVNEKTVMENNAQRKYFYTSTCNTSPKRDDVARLPDAGALICYD